MIRIYLRKRMILYKPCRSRHLDKKIAPLVNALRTAGFHTISSCQGGKGHPQDYPYVVMTDTYIECIEEWARNNISCGFEVEEVDRWKYTKKCHVFIHTHCILKPENLNDFS